MHQQEVLQEEKESRLPNTVEIVHFAEMFTAVAVFLGGQQGFAMYQRKKFLNGNPKSDRRRDSVSSGMSVPDKEFIRTCFDSLGLQLTNDRLLQTKEITEAIRNEGAATRIAVRDRN